MLEVVTKKRKKMFVLLFWLMISYFLLTRFIASGAPSPNSWQKPYICHSFLPTFFSNLITAIAILFLKKILFIYRQRGKEGERGRETSMCGCLSGTPYWGPGLQPRHVPWLGIKVVTLWFADWHSVHWAVPAGAQVFNTVAIYPVGEKGVTLLL